MVATVVLGMTWGESREVKSDDADIDDVGGYRLSIFMGGNGDWYITILKPGDRLGPCVRLAMSGGASSKFPGIGVALKDLYESLGGQEKKSNAYVVLEETEDEGTEAIAVFDNRAEADIFVTNLHIQNDWDAFPHYKVSVLPFGV